MPLTLFDHATTVTREYARAAVADYRRTHAATEPEPLQVYLLWLDQTVLGVYRSERAALSDGNLLRRESGWTVERRRVGG